MAAPDAPARRRGLTLAVGAVGLAVPLAACSASTGSPAPSGKGAVDPFVTLTVADVRTTPDPRRLTVVYVLPSDPTCGTVVSPVVTESATAVEVGVVAPQRPGSSCVGSAGTRTLTVTLEAPLAGRGVMLRPGGEGYDPTRDG